MRIDILTLFPDFFREPFEQSLIGRARRGGLVDIEIHNLRDFTDDPHRNVDDTPYGGGAGMVFRAEPMAKALRALNEGEKNAKVIYLSAEGVPLTQRRANQLSLEKRLVVICGRYKGIDERIRQQYVTDEISIGDYVLSGGEPAAVVLVDAVVRLIPEVMGDFESALMDSFQDGLLDCPWYTRPREFEGMRVPEILVQGNHAEIRRWRRRQALKRTLERRPDLLERAELSEEDLTTLSELSAQGCMERE